MFFFNVACDCKSSSAESLRVVAECRRKEDCSLSQGSDVAKRKITGMLRSTAVWRLRMKIFPSKYKVILNVEDIQIGARNSFGRSERENYWNFVCSLLMLAVVQKKRNASRLFPNLVWSSNLFFFRLAKGCGKMM